MLRYLLHQVLPPQIRIPGYRPMRKSRSIKARLIRATVKIVVCFITVASAAGLAYFIRHFEEIRKYVRENSPVEPYDFSRPKLDVRTGRIAAKGSSCHPIWVGDVWRTDHLPKQACNAATVEADMSHPQFATRLRQKLNLNSTSSTSAAAAAAAAAAASAAFDIGGHHCRGVVWVTYITSCSLGTNRFAQSVVNSGIPLAVLGLGTYWRSQWGFRMRALHDFLLTVPDETLVIFSDSEDVIATPDMSPEKALSRFDKLVKLYKGPRVFFPAEVACYPKGPMWPRFVHPRDIPGTQHMGPSPFRYLNAGVMVGPAALVRRLQEVVYQRDCADDQLLYQLALLDPVVWWRAAWVDGRVDGGREGGGDGAGIAVQGSNSSIGQYEEETGEEERRGHVGKVEGEQDAFGSRGVQEAEGGGSSGVEYCVVSTQQGTPALSLPSCAATVTATSSTSSPYLRSSSSSSSPPPSASSSSSSSSSSTSSSVDFPPWPPSEAKPLIGLDHWNIMLLAMYGMDSRNFFFDPSHRQLKFSETRSNPLILHQNGDKRESCLLEVLSREMGYEFSEEAVRRFERQGKMHPLASTDPLAEQQQ